MSRLDCRLYETFLSFYLICYYIVYQLFTLKVKIIQDGIKAGKIGVFISKIRQI